MMPVSAREHLQLVLYPYALNETIRILIRTIVPFLILIGVPWCANVSFI